MLSTEDRPKRRYSSSRSFIETSNPFRSTGKTIVESGSEADEAFDVPSKRKASAPKKEKQQEDEDFQLAIELSKADHFPATNGRRSSSRPSFVFEGAEDGSEDEVFEDDEEEEEPEMEEPSDEDEDDDAFSESEDDEPKKPAKKGKKAAATTAKVPAKKAAAPSKHKKAPIAKTAPAPKSSASVVTASAPRPVSKLKSFPTPIGVSISQGDGPRRRVGLSRTHAPKGPLSPVKIIKPNQ